MIDELAGIFFVYKSATQRGDLIEITFDVNELYIGQFFHWVEEVLKPEFPYTHSYTKNENGILFIYHCSYLFDPRDVVRFKLQGLKQMITGD